MIDKILIPFVTKSGFNNELVPYYCGIQHCTAGHSWGPGIRDHFLIHYIIDGFGTFKINNKEYHLEKDQLFLTCPNAINSYQADETNPWSYLWIGFYGLKAEYFLKRSGLSLENPVTIYNKDDLLFNCISEMLNCKENKRSGDLKFTGLLYDFLALLIENNNDQRRVEDTKNRKEQYFQKALEFICMNYSHKISISGIAKYVGIDRKYLHYIFKSHFGMSPQEYLINYRIQIACNLLEDKSLTIGQVSHSCGYPDPLLFSKIFKKIKGVSPTEYKKNNKQGY